MKKSGFTLAELIITLSIVGVAAAMIAPALTNLVPDKNKIKVLRFHANLQNAVSDILNDENLYHPYTNTVDGTNYYFTKDVSGNTSCEGLACVDGDVPRLLEERLNLPDGSNLSNGGSVEEGLRFLIDIDTGKNGCSFAASDCTFAKVDTFVFRVDKYGAITAGDVLTDAYLRNPLNMNDRKTDQAYVKTNKNKKY